MKKILTAIVTLMLMLALVCCANAEGITGDWYGDYDGMVAKVTLNEDGTYAMEIAGNVSEGAWVQEEAMMYMDKGTEYEVAFAYDAAAQTLTMQGEELVLGRDVIEAWTPAAARAEVAAEDFTGTWTATYVDVFGMNGMPAEAAGAFADAVIEGTKVSVTVTFMEPEVFEGEAVLEGANMTLTIPAENEFTKEQVFVFGALEDGMITIGWELFGEPVLYYLEKVEAVAE